MKSSLSDGEHERIKNILSVPLSRKKYFNDLDLAIKFVDELLQVNNNCIFKILKGNSIVIVYYSVYKEVF